MRAFIPLFASLIAPFAVQAGTITHKQDGSWIGEVLRTKMPVYAYLEECIEYAAYRHNVMPELILAVISVENGADMRINPNNNGSVDHGIMQINTVRMPEIEHYGVSIDDLVNNDCLNVFMGTYLLSNELAKTDDFWEGVGNYHYSINGRFPNHHYRYIQDVFNAWSQIID